MLQPQRYWEDFCRAIGRRELIEDERFAETYTRAKNAEAYIEILDKTFASKSRDEWLRILRDSEGDFIFTIVNGINDLPDDPQVRANDYVIDFEHPQHGKIQMLGLPVRLSETPGSVRSPAPELGQHTEANLRNVGYSDDEIAAMREKGVF